MQITYYRPTWSPHILSLKRASMKSLHPDRGHSLPRTLRLPDSELGCRNRQNETKLKKKVALAFSEFMIFLIE